MKESSAIKLSISSTPLIFFAVWGSGAFALSILTFPFEKTICWEGGILAAICYGFLSIQLFLQNAHFENLNRNEKEN